MRVKPLTNLLLHLVVISFGENDRLRVGEFFDLIGERLRCGTDRRKHRFGRGQTFKERLTETLRHHFHRTDLVHRDEIFRLQRELERRDAYILERINIHTVFAKKMRALHTFGRQYAVLAVEGAHQETAACFTGHQMISIKPADALAFAECDFAEQRRFADADGARDKKIFRYGICQRR